MKHRGINRMIAILMGAIFILGMVPALSWAENDPQPATPTTIEEGKQNDPAASPAPATSTNLEVDVDALFDALMACQTWEAAQAVMGEYSEEEWDYFRAELDPRKVELLIAHLEELQNGSNTPAVNFTDAAPFLPPVTGVTRARFFAAPAQAKGTDTPGVETLKTATYNPDTGDYTIRLESWVTGAQTTTETTVPTDIVLVLDQSGSMSGNMVAGYNPVIGGSYTYGNMTYYGFNDYNSDYYIKLSDGSYQRVSYYYNYYDNKNFDYYGYLNSSYDWVYVYPRLADGTTNATRQYNYQVVQFYSAETITRLEALQSAVTDFCDAVADKAAGADGELSTTADNVNHRIAIVGFASSYNYYISNPYENTELFDGATQTGYGSLSSGDSNYQNAFKDMNTQAGYDSAIASKNALSASGGTFVDLGMNMASEIFKANPLVSGEQRNRVVIVFTDGTPGGTEYGSVNKNAANAAISRSDTIKNKNQGYGATVYTIGIFSGADANSVGNQNAGSTTADYANWFMQNLSSNNGTPQTPSYYLSAGDSSGLSSVFQAIQSNIGGATTTLDGTTVVKDIVSPYFTLPVGTSANDISLYTADCTGKDPNNKLIWGADTAATGLTPGIDGNTNTVTVTGFDFSDNWCGPRTSGSTTTYSGKKLVIEFKVKARPGFLGGNNVDTNGANSGIYTTKDGEETCVENFVIPTVNVPIKYEIAANDQSIYLGNDVDLNKILDYVTSGTGGVNFTPDGTNNAFVDIEYKLYQGTDTTGTPIGAYTIGAKNTPAAVTEFGNANPKLTQDTGYTLTCTVKPSEEPAPGTTTVANKVCTAPATVHVFVPTVAAKDATIYLTNPVNPLTLFDGDKTTWACTGSHGTDLVPTPEGTKPTINGVTFATLDGTSLAGEQKPTDCTQYMITAVTLSNAYEYTLPAPEAGETETRPQPWVHVLVPKIAFTDETIWLGEHTILAERWPNTQTGQWADAKGDTGIPTATGTEPTVTITAKLVDTTTLAVAANISADSKIMQPKLPGNYDFVATIKIGDVEQIGDKPIRDCCKITKPSVANGETDHDFTIIVKACQLTLDKSGGKAGESYLFTITYTDPWSGASVTLHEAIQGNDSATIIGLPIGSYTVAEKTDWSWRYASTNVATFPVSLTGDTPNGAVTVTNSGRSSQWLSAEAGAINRWLTTGLEAIKNFFAAQPDGASNNG